MERFKLLLNRLIAAATVGLIATTGVSLSACNTVEGAGEDIEGAGEAIEDAAD